MSDWKYCHGCGLSRPLHHPHCPFCFKAVNEQMQNKIIDDFLDSKISIDDAVIGMIRHRMKPYPEEIRSEEEKLVREFLEGIGTKETLSESIINLSKQKKTMLSAPVFCTLKNSKQSKPIKMSPLEWLRRNA